MSALNEATALPSIQVSPQSLCDLELLATGAFAPLSRFMSHAEYRSVIETGRLPDGTPFPVPVTLDVGGTAALGTRVALRSPSNHVVAILDIEEVFEGFSVSGPLKIVELPRHFDFRDLRQTPAKVREWMGDRPMVAYSPAGVMRRWEEEFTKRAATDAGANLLIQPVVCETKMEDFTRLQALRTLVDNYYDPQTTLLSLLPLSTNDPVLRAIVHKNYGATHMIVGREYAQQVSEVGLTPIPFNPASGGDLRPEVAAILEQAYPPKSKQGLCIWFTGLPSAGKSTIAEILAIQLMEHGRRITMLDGDVVRTHLSKGLGFSPEDRDVNIRRLGFVAGEIARHNGTAIVAAVSPYEATRNQAREMVGSGRFVLVYVSTPANICEGRDVKGFYRQARAGELKNFTGVDDPYEPPLNPEIRIETVDCTPEQNAHKVFEWLRSEGYIS